ncbi:hypothetical protein BKA82DRAFT_33837 [Pisolithus tinctorius]|nr:hypothetical protein BKA82DRAFT_33837 [Pisolithus tinctorius]
MQHELFAHEETMAAQELEKMKLTVKLEELCVQNLTLQKGIAGGEDQGPSSAALMIRTSANTTSLSTAIPPTGFQVYPLVDVQELSVHSNPVLTPKKYAYTRLTPGQGPDLDVPLVIETLIRLIR